MRRTRKSYHEVLGVARDAPPAEVKRAYRALAKRLHPDRLSDPEAAHVAEERLKEVNAAWHDFLAAVRSGEQAAERRRPKPRPAAPEADEHRVDEAAYEPPHWRQRHQGRQSRDRYRTERVRASRDRAERERQSREQASEVRRARDAEIRARVAHDRARAAGLLSVVTIGLTALLGLVLILVALWAFGAATR